MKITIPIFLLTLLGLSACTTAEMAYSPAMEHETLAVKGRNGLQIGQVIRYGAFTTDKVRRGWTKAYDIPFVVRFQGAREKISFTQYGPGGQQAEVACISKFKSLELPLIRDYFSVPLHLKNYFAGTIISGGAAEAWDFILHNPDGDFLRDRPTSGYLKKGAEIISIRPVKGLEGQPGWMKNLSVYGHEFWQGDQVVAAVSTLNKGTVWMNPQLDERLQVVIAAVATGLLLRTDVEAATES